MKAIVLAGGHATRLWPLTKHRAKPLLPLGGRPIISYVLDELEDIEDVDEIFISTNAKFADDFQAFLEEHDYPKTRVLVEDHTTEEQKIGSLGAIIQVIRENGNDDYVVVGGDNYTTFSVADFVSFAQEKEAITNACYDLPDEDDASQFGVIETDDEQEVTGFEEKPDNPSSSLISTAFYFFPESAMTLFDDYIAAHKDTDTNYLDEPGRLIEWGHSRYDMCAYPFDGGWYDIGTPENYLRAQAAVENGFARGTVNDSELGENVWVMEGAIVEDSELEDCIIFPDARISDAVLENCIIDEKATVKGKELDGAVIGEHSRVQ